MAYDIFLNADDVSNDVVTNSPKSTTTAPDSSSATSNDDNSEHSENYRTIIDNQQKLIDVQEKTLAYTDMIFVMIIIILGISIAYLLGKFIHNLLN